MAIIDANRQNQPTAYNENKERQVEKTLYELRLEHEKAISDFRFKYAQLLSKKEIELLDKHGTLSKQQADNIAKYEQQLREKYSAAYQKELKDNADFQKKLNERIAKEAYDETKKQQKKNVADKLKDEQKFAKIAKDQAKQQKKNGELDKKQYKEKIKEQNKELKQSKKQAVKDLKALGASTEEIFQAKIGDEMTKNLKASLGTALNGFINGWKQKLQGTISDYTSYQRKVNVRLQGSSSRWQDISKTLNTTLGATPWLKTQQVMDNVIKATEQGIAFNIEQRAFLAGISENIASTFDAFDSNLSRIIRLQQADSTAARLGLEASLTKFLNSQFSDTSYLNNVFDSVSANLLEATAVMSAEKAVGFEYQIQKWLGSLVSVGFSESAAGQIASALGMLGSGNVSGLASNTALQNLIVMSASRAGLNYSDLLVKGLDESNTNKLMQSMVTYLQEIADSDNKVVKSQYAQIFGMNVSDLAAVKNLIGQVNSIAKNTLNYSSAVNELYDQLTWQTMTERIGVPGMLQNMMENMNYMTGINVASNPITYALWQVTDMLEDVTGGIALPTLSVMGNMVDLNTTVTNLMRAGIVGVSTLGNIGAIISGLGNTVNPSNMLSKLGINRQAAAQTSRGSGLNRRAKAARQLSASTLVGNVAGSDYYDTSITAANESTSSQIEAAKESSTDITLNDMHQYLLQVFDPKLTEIERLVALLAGYDVGNVSANTTFGTYKTDNGTVYGATSVNIKDFDEKKNQLNTINDNVANILEILRDGTIKVTVDEFNRGGLANYGGETT